LVGLWPRKRKSGATASDDELARAQTAIGPSLTKSFGRYQTLRKLASGGMADLYLAEIKGESAFEKRVAIKHMHPHLAEKPEIREYFLDEARLAAQLSHPNIVHVNELGSDERGLPFIAMEYVEGFDLAALEGRLTQPMPLRAALTIAIGVCEGLHHAHTAASADGTPLNIVHRDMKPQNVLLSHDGAVKVTDFGIAKASRQVHVTEIGTIAGTASYMAPEQRTGQAVDLRADVYGVGAILYELITGTTIDLDLARLAPLGLEGWPHLVPASQARPGLPPALDAMVTRALAYRPDDRYPDCRTLQRDLEQVLIASGEAPSTSYLAEWFAQVGVGRKPSVPPGGKTPAPNIAAK
jgi:serine/threonine-protein kinase